MITEPNNMPGHLILKSGWGAYLRVLTVPFVGQTYAFTLIQNRKRSGPLFRKLISSLLLKSSVSLETPVEPLQASLSALPHANIDPKEMHEKLIILFKHWFRSGNISKFVFLLHVRTLGLRRCNTRTDLQHRKQNCIYRIPFRTCLK